MIIAKKSWQLSSATRLAIVAIASCFFPLGIVYAQDFEAVERRLGEAVGAGELSLDQAKLMMEALMRSQEADEREEATTIRRLATALEEAGVQRDSIRPALGMARRLAGQIAEEGNRFEMGEDTANYLRKELNLNREQIGVVLRIAEHLADLAERGSKEERRFREIAERIEAAVERGDLSKEDAERKLIEMRKEMFGNDEDRESKMDEAKRRYMGIVERIKAAVERGDLSEEDAERKLIEMRKEMFGNDK
jgi:polyhydroxyalkanoate synthesis regulator phasin